MQHHTRDETVMLFVLVCLIGRHTGLGFELRLAYLWRFRAGKVVYFRSLRDPEEALELASLSGTEPTSSGPPAWPPASTRSE